MKAGEKELELIGQEVELFPLVLEKVDIDSKIGTKMNQGAMNLT